MRMKSMEMKLKENIANSFSLGRKKYYYNNDKCKLLDGMNTREILIKDAKIGDIVKLQRGVPSIRVLSKPNLMPYTFGGYRWHFDTEKVERVKGPEEE